MSSTPAHARRLTPSLIVSVLALVVALSGTAYAIGKGEVTTRHLAPKAVTTAKIKDGAVTAPKLRAGAVSGAAIRDGSVATQDLAAGSVVGRAVADGSLRLSDLGGETTDQTTVVPGTIAIPAHECRTIFLTLFNPAPNGVIGSLVVGTLTTPAGGPVLNNSGYATPTLVTETSQGGAIPRFQVCAAESAQSVPAGSVVNWSLLSP